MIRQLIKDIAYDNIQLSQALTRAKLVASKIKNETFKKWLNCELEGYNYTDSHLPKYRKVWSPMYLNAEFPFGRTETITVNLPDDFDKEEFDMVTTHRILEPIAIVEEQILSIQKSKGYINLTPNQVEIIASFYKDSVSQYGGLIRSGNREVGKVQYQNVLELTKQKLLDTLMELDEEFPDLNDDYTMTKENTEKVQHIITNNIYGNNNPMNIATGNDIEQSLNQNITLSQENEQKLKSLGVEQENIEDLKEILLTSTDKSTKTSKIMKWLGNVTASVAGKGLSDNLPVLIEFVHSLII